METVMELHTVLRFVRRKRQKLLNEATLPHFEA